MPSPRAARRPLKVARLLAIIACANGLAGLRAADTWQVPDAQYRAVIQLSSPAKSTEAGVAIELPEFGVTRPDATDCLLTDSKGQTIPMATLWRGEGQSVILAAQDLKAGVAYHVYFGGKARRGNSAGWSPKVSLLMETRRMPANAKFDTWPEMESSWRRAAEVDGAGLVSQIHHGKNPFGEGTKFLTRYTGYLTAAAGGQTLLYTLSSDASFVLVNEKLAFDWPGRHGARATEATVHGKTLQLSGLTRIDYYHAAAGGKPPTMLLGWKKGESFEPIPASAWLHPGQATVQRIEDQRGRPIPVCTIQTDSYIGYGGNWLFDTACSVKTDSDWAAQWIFDDGAIHEGAQVRRILAGTGPHRVILRLSRNGEEVRGIRKIDFADVRRPASIENPAQLQNYLSLISGENPEQLSTGTLRAYFEFLRDFGEEQQIGRFGEAWVRGTSDPNDPIWIEAQLARLRSLAQTDPAVALAQMRKIDSGMRQKFSTRFDLFEIDTLVFGLRDPSAVARVQQIAFQNAKTDIARVARIRLADLYRITGREALATEHYEAVQKSIVEESGGRKLPAQDRAYSITIQDLIQGGYRREAMEKLGEWELAHPMAKLNSDFLLLRARALMLFGRWLEALHEIESFDKLTPDSPFQIDSSFYRARALYELGRKDEARKLWAQIAETYPKHELAKSSREWAARK